MTLIPTFEEELAGILTDYRNQAGSLTSAAWLAKYADTSGNVPDVSKEALIRFSVLASAKWGLRKYARDYIRKQIFPDTADSENLAHHAWLRDLTKLAGEDDAQFLARILNDIRHKNAGGNKYDYVTWAEEVTGVAKGYSYPLARGRGTVDVLLVADLDVADSEDPSKSARIGFNTSAAAGKLIDTGATFTTAHAVAIGDVVENPMLGLETYVTAVDSANQLSLNDDIFPYGNYSYIVHVHTGTNTDIVAGSLKDTGADFQNVTDKIRKGDPVYNITDGTETTVVSVTSAGQILLADDIFLAAGKKYVIKSLIARVKSHIDGLIPCDGVDVLVTGPTIVTQAVNMGTTGQSLNLVQIAADITTYMNSLIPNETLMVDQIKACATQNGAKSAPVSTPAADVTATAYQMIRPGVITVL